MKKPKYKMEEGVWVGWGGVGDGLRRIPQIPLMSAYCDWPGLNILKVLKGLDLALKRQGYLIRPLRH